MECGDVAHRGHSLFELALEYSRYTDGKLSIQVTVAKTSDLKKKDSVLIIVNNNVMITVWPKRYDDIVC